MKGILLRVGCDQTETGGFWNAPANPDTWDYAYVPIPGDEHLQTHIVPCPTFGLFAPSVARFGVSLPSGLPCDRKAHLDPDFASLTYGEPPIEDGRLSQRGAVLSQLDVGDVLAFYAGFCPLPSPRSKCETRLAYCMFGIFYVARKTLVKHLTRGEPAICAHGRRRNAGNDLVIWGDPKRSGRFASAIPIGEWRNGAYRVTADLLTAWGGLTVKDGWLQRSAQPPWFRDTPKFLQWLCQQGAASHLLRRN